MMIDSQARYLKTHEWIKKQDGNIYAVGLSAYAIEQLGDIVYMELPEVGRSLQKEEPFGVVESVKVASDMYAPVAGTVTSVNGEIPENPDLLKKDAYDAGWIIKIEVSDPSELESLMDEAAYKKFLDTEA